MADRNTDTSDLVNEVHVHGAGALIPEEVEKTIRYHYSASLPFKIDRPARATSASDASTAVARQVA